MNIESHNMGAYNLHFIKTNKFKTISVDVNFYREIKEDEITKRNLLKMILLDSNNDYKTEPEWGVKSFNLNKQTGNFNITVTAGKERYPDTKIYVALYRNGVLVSVKSFVYKV